MISNSYCKKHDEIEPENHDFFTDGLWTCKNCARENSQRQYKEYINGTQKLLDKAMADILKEYPNILDKRW